MASPEPEDALLHSAALQNAASILAARQRMERELVAAKEELAGTVARLRATLDSTTDAIVVTDRDGTLIDYNEQFLRLWQMPAQLAASRDYASLREFVLRQLAAPGPFLARVEEIQAKAPPETFDVFELADGRVFERHSRVQVVKGATVGRVWSFRDITSHRLAAAELREQREWFRVTLASIGDAVITTDLNAHVTFLNPVAEQMTGWSNGDAQGRALEDVFHVVNEVSREKVKHPIAQALREGAVVGLANHTTLLSRDGRETAIEDSAAPIRDAGGKVTGAVMVFHDVTARRRAEDALRDREERLRAVVHQAAVGIAVASLAGQFEEVNGKLCDILGYSEAELLAQGFAEITLPEDLPETRANIRKLLDGKCADFTHEKRYVRKDGSILWSRTTVTLLKDARESPQRFVGIVQDITQHKVAEEALQRSEAQLRAMADSIPQLAWMAEADGGIFWYNRRWFEYTGTTLEQMQGWGWQTVHDPEILPQVIERWQQSLRTGEPFDMEFPLRGADGAFRWFLTRVNPVEDGQGRVVRWFGTNTDVDQVKRAEDALREETRVLELLNGTGTAIASQLDLQALLQTVTDAATKLSGARFGAFFYTAKDESGGVFKLYTLSGAPREAFEKFGHPRATALFGPIFEGKPPVRCDDVLQDPRYAQSGPHYGMPKGHPPVRSFLAVPVISRTGEVLGGLFFGHPDPGIFNARSERLIVGIAAQAAIAIDNAKLYEAAQREIAVRAETEQRLRESETRLRVSLENAALGTWELEVDQGIVSLDHRCQELFRLPGRSTISLQEWIEVGHPEHRESRAELLRKVSDGRRDRYDIEYRVAGTDGWLKASAKPVRDAQGQVVRVVGAILDITDLMKARATIEERQRDLERLVTERTASLQQAIAQMEEFSYSVSHDLRAPLRAIHSYAETLLEDFGEKIGPEGGDYLQRIMKAGSRMDRLTREVLTYSKIARERVPLGKIDLERLVHELVAQYAPDHQRTGAIVVASPLHPVIGQETLLAQVISNLLANALKFIAPGVAPHIGIWSEKHGDLVRVWVEDNGIGIEPEHQNRIWGMFERVHPNEAYEGTGIGLAIVRKAVERMGGLTGVESDGRSGSKFWIQLGAAEE